MSRFIIVALGVWLAIGGCSAPLVSCPLLADSPPHHDDCCPRNKPSQALTECPSFVAVKVVPADAVVLAIAEIAPEPAAILQLAPVFHSSSQDKQKLYLSIGVLRI